MKKKSGSICLMGSVVALGVLLVVGAAGADDIAWDMVSSTSQNLTNFSTDAPVFSSPGDGFQKYTVGVSPSIPYAIVDDSGGVYPADQNGIIDSGTDFDEFFGICDSVNDDNLAGDPYHATWVFNIASAAGDVMLQLDLAAMGNFELADPTFDPPIVGDTYEWTYQVDAGAPQTFLTSSVDEGGTMTYTLAGGTVVELDDPLTVNGVALSNVFQTFLTPIPSGSQVTVVLTAVADGGSEGYVARNIVISDYDPTQGGGEPIPTLSEAGIALMTLLLMAGGVFLFRRLR